MLFLGTCPPGLAVVVRILKEVIRYVTILVPILLVVIGTFDLLKAVTAAKEDEIKAAQKLLIKRVVYALLIFLIVPILTLFFSVFDSATKGEGNVADYQSWYSCWSNPS